MAFVPNELKYFVNIYPEILLSVIFSVKLKHFTQWHKDTVKKTHTHTYTHTFMHIVNDGYGRFELYNIKKCLPGKTNSWKCMMMILLLLLPLSLWIWFFCYRVLILSQLAYSIAVERFCVCVCEYNILAAQD